MAIVKFENPQNGYIETYNPKIAPWWCLLFGPIYWLVRGNISHAIISLALALLTVGISHFIYPFFANKVNFKAYGRKGWIQTDKNIPTAPIEAETAKKEEINQSPPLTMGA